MRIISGRAGGIRLRAPSGDAVRPTTDRVKESVFAALGDLRGLVVADLFSGSGALGLEALSRGAAAVLFVERDRGALRFLKENLANVLKAIGPDAGEPVVVAADAARVPGVLGSRAGSVDLILADPPYRAGRGDYGAPELLTDARFSAWAGEALLVLEHAADATLPWFPGGAWQLVRERRYGTVAVSWARVATPQGSSVGSPRASAARSPVRADTQGE